MRVFRMQKSPERVETRPGTGAYERLNPQKNLKGFSVQSSELCVVTLRLEEGVNDPVELAFPIKFFINWVMRDTGIEKKVGEKKFLRRGRLLKLQYCADAGGPFRMSKIFPRRHGKLVLAKNLAHLIAHLAMIHSSFYASDAGQTPRFEETTFYNEHNSRELIIVYNWPLRGELVSGFLRVALDYLDSCVAGKPDKNFLKHLERQQQEHEESREWEKEPT